MCSADFQTRLNTRPGENKLLHLHPKILCSIALLTLVLLVRDGVRELICLHV